MIPTQAYELQKMTKQARCPDRSIQVRLLTNAKEWGRFINTYRCTKCTSAHYTTCTKLLVSQHALGETLFLGHFNETVPGYPYLGTIISPKIIGKSAPMMSVAYTMTFQNRFITYLPFRNSQLVFLQMKLILS